ncbi:hypothetical protein BDN72DRAFT_838776 [Pluteus cervinus]|uniref:Uncharacterized protein n=1 Tax=Pluteus cervinus TaxID=181527 RepID=A0ACD3AYV4_9AGAR|nr:hypothetical protein BDN72DRAFT_838776 [Pluteus cervinus]
MVTYLVLTLFSNTVPYSLGPQINIHRAQPRAVLQKKNPIKYLCTGTRKRAKHGPPPLRRVASKRPFKPGPGLTTVKLKELQ